MTLHPDEGTLHAYIDGELPRAEAVALERHVGECARCAAALAEARGFVAAASRAISALDAAPSSAGAARPPVAVTAPVTAPRFVSRSIFRAPYARAAALLLLAGGTAVVADRAGTPEPATSERAVSVVQDAAPLSGTASAAAPEAAAATSTAPANEVPAVAGRDLSTRALAGGAGTVTQKVVSPRRVAADQATEPTRPPLIAPAAPPPPAPARAEARLEAVVVTGATSPTTSVTRYRTKEGVAVTLTSEPLRATFAEATVTAGPRTRAAQSAAASVAVPVVNSYRWSSPEQGRTYTLTGPLNAAELEALSKKLSELERVP